MDTIVNSRNLTTEMAKNGSSAMVEKIMRRIDRMIGEGKLLPGDPISEPVICEAMNVSRVPVREAIRLLAGEGVLELSPYRSARVRLASAKEIIEMMEVLNGFSVLAIHLICVKPIKQEFIEELRGISDKIKQISRNPSSTSLSLMREVSLYHYRLIQESENEYLLNLLAKTRMHYYSRSLLEIIGRHALIEAAPAYAKATTAIASGDRQKAVKILFDQVERSRAHARMQ